MTTLANSDDAFKRDAVSVETVIGILTAPRGTRVADLARTYGMSEYEVIRVRKQVTARYKRIADAVLRP